MTDTPDADLLFVRCQPQVLRYLTRMVGHAETARDLTQETFLRASRGSAPADEPGRRAWVFRIARNVALNHLRDTARRHVPAADLPGAGAPAAQETALLVREALAQLAELDRDVFMLRESAGLNYAEIAHACAITEDAVRSRLQRARQALRVLLDGTLQAERARGVSISGRTEP
jgi:RNA polymerase sigma-70 factor (ECF subfamily)